MQPLHEKEKGLDELISLIPDDSDIVIPLTNGEPNQILKAIDQHPERFSALRLHQLLEVRDRNYIKGAFPHIRYNSYFLGAYARTAFNNHQCELIPNNFRSMPELLEKTAKNPIVVTQAAPMDDEGYFSLGTTADYTAYFIGKIPFILQVNEEMPRTYGENKIHLSEILGFVTHHEPLIELPSAPVKEIDIVIAEHIAERIDHGSTLQIGIGGIPNAVVSLLKGHRDLGIHTEMLTDGVVELVKAGVVTGAKKNTHIGKMVATFAFGSKELYQFMHENKGIEMLPVHYVNDPRNIGKEDKMVTLNATTEIDFYGQCASETVAGKYYSSTGGQADFSNGVQFSKNGKGFICMYSTAKNETISRIRPVLAPGNVVTTSKNNVDYVVTEYGIAELKGKSIFERTKSLIELAHPKFREELTYEAKRWGFSYNGYRVILKKEGGKNH